MKKIIIILLILKMTVNAFTIDFSGEIFGAFNLFDYFDDEIGMGGGERGRIRLEGSENVENFGGWARLDVSSLQSSPVGIYGYVFYQPFDFLSFYVTRNQDGHFELDGNALWNFYGLPGDVIGITHDCSYTGSFTFDFDDATLGTPGFNNAFYSGFTEGAFLSITPIKALTINWGFPVFENLVVEDMMKSMTLQITLNLEKAGLFGLTYSGGSMSDDYWDDSAVIRAYFGTTISIVKFDFGAGFMLSEKNNRAAWSGVAEDIRSYPISFGAAAAFNAGKVNIKTRALLTGFGSLKYEGVKYKTPVDFIIDILPSTQLNDKAIGYLNFSLFIHTQDEDNNYKGWSLYPYVTIGNNDFYAFYTGLELIYREDFYCRIPFGISINF